MILLASFLALMSVSILFLLRIEASAPASRFPSVWFYSGLAMLLFSMFYVEPYYTAPRNVLAHSITVILVLISVRGSAWADQTASLWWLLLLAYSALMGTLSWSAIVLQDQNLSPSHIANRVSCFMKDVAVTFGQGRVLYSGVFLLFLPLLNNLRNAWVLAVLVFWWLIVMINPAKRIAEALATYRQRSAALGEIFSVQSSQAFLARALPGSPSVRSLEAVEFSFSATEGGPCLRRGVVADCYELDDAHWFKIVQLCTSSEATTLSPNEVRRLPKSEEPSIAGARERLVGLVCEGSDIKSIRFEILSSVSSLQEGDLVETSIYGQRVFYQVVNGTTATERLEERNETGFVCGEAIQLGRWNGKEQTFDAFGWVPAMDSPVLKACSDMQIAAIALPEYRLGVIPGTKIPVVLNLDVARSHHLAVLGITGAGKTFIALALLRELCRDTKVICVDFTAEYMTELKDLIPHRLIDPDGLAKVEELMARRADTKNKTEILEYRGKIEAKLDQHVQEFMESDNNLAVFELPDLSNTSFILEFTQMFLDAIFRYAKSVDGSTTCLVIEEAHTVIPETTSLGDFGDYSSNKALVNKISQIALQGRKYGVGFWVIAQRTANVSKTVLTQCNSLLCFQAFDETSYRFLENHLGQTMVGTIPRLKRYHAIAVGKAFRGNVPLIVDLTRD